MRIEKIRYRYLTTWLRLKFKQLLSAILPKHKNYSKFIILCSPRTGSTLLHTYLNSHPNIYSHGEILRRDSFSRIHPGTTVFKRYGSNIKAVGLKVFYEYAHQGEFQNAYEQIVFDSSIKVIHVVREEIKNQYLSLMNSYRTGHWNSANKKQFEYVDEIDPQEFNAFVTQLDSQRSICIGHFKDHSTLVISYEMLTDDKEETLQLIQKFLKVEPKQLSTLLVKIRKQE